MAKPGTGRLAGQAFRSRKATTAGRFPSETPRFATLLGSGRYLPEREVTNAMLKERVARVDPERVGLIDRYESSTAIRTRFYAPDEWSTSDLAVRAAERALEDAGIGARDLDLIIVGTDTPDYITPATSVVVQHKLGTARAGTFDVGCACASFPTGMAVAGSLLTTSPWMSHVLVVGAYMMHRLADPGDPASFFYGDGAGAVVLGAGDEPGLVASAFRALGGYHRSWGIFAGGTVEPATEESVREGRTCVRMLQSYPPEVNHEGWPKIVRHLAERGGFAVDAINMAIFTQVRRPSIEKVMDTLGLPRERTHCIMDRWGYTGSACIPMALDDARRSARIAAGDLVALVGSGVGANQAGVALRMPA